MSSLDYSRFDNIGSDSDEEVNEAEEIRKTSWGPLEELKRVADGLFGVAEKDGAPDSFKRALQHYDELLPRIQELIRADPANLDKGYHMTVSCHLNACCCFIRTERWSEANERCCIVLLTSKAKGHNLTPIEEMRTRYFRIMSAVPLLAEHTQLINQYKQMGIESVNDKEASECFDYLQDDGEALAELLMQGHVSQAEQQQYVDALENAHDAVEKFGHGEEVPEVPEDGSSAAVSPKHHHHVPEVDENLDYDFSVSSQEQKLAIFKTQRDQALTKAARSFRDNQLEDSLRRYEEALGTCTNLRVNLRIEIKKHGKGTPGAARLEEFAFENERVAGAAGTGKGAALVKLGRLEPALAPLRKAAKALEDLKDSPSGGGDAAKSKAKATQADKKHLWTCLEALTECHSRLAQWEDALCTADKVLRVFRSDKPNKKVAGMLLSRAHMLTSLQQQRQGSVAQATTAEERMEQAGGGGGGGYEADTEAVALAWQSAADAFRDLDMHRDAHTAYCKAGKALSDVAVTHGGVQAFSDLLTFPESSTAVVDQDLCDLAYLNWMGAAREAGKWADSEKKLCADAASAEARVAHKRTRIHALLEQLQAWFEAGLCGMCLSSSPSLALRAFEAAGSCRDEYEMEVESSSLLDGTGSESTKFVNFGDLAFHFGHAYIRAGPGKHQYAAEEAANALSFYEKAEECAQAEGEREREKETEDGVGLVRRKRLALSLQALVLSFLGDFDNADLAITAIGLSFSSSSSSAAAVKGPLAPAVSSCDLRGEEQVAAVRRMIARRCPRAREREQGHAREAPPPVVAAAKPPTGLTLARRKARTVYDRAVRALDAFLSFMTGDHWTSVLAAWTLVVLTVLCVALLAAAARSGTQEL